MNTEDMIRELRNVEEKYKNKTYATGETNISLMCSEVADRLEALHRENIQLKIELIKKTIGWSGLRKMNMNLD